MMSTSSQLSCPTSPAKRSPVARSKEKRQGLRKPYAQISGNPLPFTNGLSDGIAYCLPAANGGSTPDRKIFLSRGPVLLTSRCRAPPLPPSPKAIWRNPTGPDGGSPALWLG